MPPAVVPVAGLRPLTDGAEAGVGELVGPTGGRRAGVGGDGDVHGGGGLGRGDGDDQGVRDDGEAAGGHAAEVDGDGAGEARAGDADRVPPALVPEVVPRPVTVGARRRCR